MIDRAAAILGLVLLMACAALAALLELSLVGLYAGGLLVPVAVPFALAGNWILPRLARSLFDRTAAMFAVFAAWLVPIAILALTPRPEGDVYVLGNSAMQYVFYGTFFGGIIVGIVTLVTCAPVPAARARAGAQRSGSVRYR